VYASPNVIRVMKSRGVIWGETCRKHGRDEKWLQSFSWKT
jgi:hypothetical protein